MATQVVPDACVRCDKPFSNGDPAYYIAPCTLADWGKGGYDGDVGIGRGPREGELRIRFLGGVRKDRRAICTDCFTTIKEDWLDNASNQTG